MSPKVGAVFRRCFTKTCGGFFESLSGPKTPEMLSSPDEVVGFGHSEPIADFRPMRDPRAKFLEALLDLADGDIDGMARNNRTVPGFRDHPLVAHILAAVFNKRL